MIQNVNGHILGFPAGIANTCCCGGTTGVTCPTCALITTGPNAGNPEPSMLLTILDTDYAGGDINWCGLTWTQAEVQAGVQKCVCPTFYIKNKTTTTTGITQTINGDHRWAYAGTAGLALGRGYGIALQNGTFILTGGADQNLQVGPVGKYDQHVWNYYFGWQDSFPPIYSLGILNASPAVPRPTSNSYTLVSRFFNSYTDSGVLYTWEQGENW